MIAKMKKLTFLIYHKDYDAFLKSIRDLGVIHVVTKAQGSAENAALQESVRLSARYLSAIKYLQGLNATAVLHAGDAVKGKKALDDVEVLQHQEQQLAARLQASGKEEMALEPWGNFDPKSIERLRDAGYRVDFYICSEKQFKEEWKEQYNATVINRVGSKLYFITVTPVGEYVELEVEAAKLPDVALSDLQARLADIRKRQEDVKERMKELAETVIPDLQAAQAQVCSEIEFSKVVLSGDSLADDKLVLLQGWAPIGQVEKIEEYLRVQEAYYEITDPTPDDDVPICFANL